MLSLTDKQRAELERYTKDYPQRPLRSDIGDTVMILAEHALVQDALVGANAAMERVGTDTDAQLRAAYIDLDEKLARLQATAARLVGGARNVAPAVVIVDATHLDELRHELIRQGVAITVVKDTPA